MKTQLKMDDGTVVKKWKRKLTDCRVPNELSTLQRSSQFLNWQAVCRRRHIPSRTPDSHTRFGNQTGLSQWPSVDKSGEKQPGPPLGVKSSWGVGDIRKATGTQIQSISQTHKLLRKSARSWLGLQLFHFGRHLLQFPRVRHPFAINHKHTARGPLRSSSGSELRL